MKPESLDRQFAAVVQSYHNTYMKMIDSVKDIKKYPNYPGTLKDEFILAHHEGVTLGVSMVGDEDGRHLIMVGYCDATLRQMTEGISEQRIELLLEQFRNLPDVPEHIHKAFIVPSMDDKYYSHGPLLSVESYIPSNFEISQELIGDHIKTLNRLITLVKNHSSS